MLLAIAITVLNFAHPHDIVVNEEGVGKMYHVSDTLQIKTVDHQTIDFSLDIAGTNGSSCEMKGLAAKVADHFEYTEKKCVLRIKFDKKDASVIDVGNICRLDWCGARASIGTTEFKRTKKKR
jgi:hypothetical protein